MNVAIAGYSGFIGKYLTKFFIKEGHTVTFIENNTLYKDFKLLIEQVENADILIHLNGARILQRWNKRNRRIIRDSRVLTRQMIYRALEVSKKLPSVVFLGSAVGIYNKNGIHDENSTDFSDGFIGELMTEWEETGIKINELGIRTVIMRLGIVLGRDGGALKTMLPPFKFGFGSTIADGNQLVPYIHIEDVYMAMKFIYEKTDYSGIVNFVSPERVTNHKFSKVLGKILKKPVWMKIPAFIFRLWYGEASVLLTGGQNVLPGVLLRLGYEFRFSDIRSSLQNLIK